MYLTEYLFSVNITGFKKFQRSGISKVYELKLIYCKIIYYILTKIVKELIITK